MNKIKIFYTKRGEEIKTSLERYFRFAKSKLLDDSCFYEVPQKDSYFYKFYSAKFSDYQLYFIIDEDLSYFKDENKLSSTGFMISMIVDLLLSKGEYNYDIYVNGVIKPEIEDCEYFGEFKVVISPERGDVPNFVKIRDITQFEDIGFISKIVAHPHSGKNPSVEKLIISKKESRSGGNEENENIPQRGEEQLNIFFGLSEDEKALIKNSVFILIIDDVLGDYTKTFLPFYTLIKYKVKSKNIIMRGIKDPTEFEAILEIFPADLILVDISFEKLKAEREKYFWAAEVDVGIQLFNAIFSQLQSGGFSKKTTPYVRIFSSFKRGRKNLKEIWIQKDEIKKLIDWIKKFDLEAELKNLSGHDPKNYFIVEHQNGVPKEVFYKLIYLKKYFNKGDEKNRWLRLVSHNPIGKVGDISEKNLIETHDVFLKSIVDSIKKKEDIKNVKIYNGTEDLTNGEPIFPEEI